MFSVDIKKKNTPLFLTLFSMTAIFLSSEPTHAEKRKIQEAADIEAFNAFIQDTKHPIVLVFIRKEGCPYCQVLAPTIEKLLKENKRKDVSIIKIEKEKVPALIADAKIRQYPTVVIYKNGKIYENAGKKSIYQGCSSKPVMFFKQEIKKVIQGATPAQQT